MQDMKSVYVDIRESILNHRRNGESDNGQIDFSDLEFQIDLLKTDEINLDYILALILEKSKEHDDVESLKAEVRRVIRSSLGTRAKEGLIMDFIKLAPNKYLVDGSMNVEDLGHLLNKDFETEEFDSVAGYIIENIDRFPKKGEDIILNNIKFHIAEASKNRIDKIIVDINKNN